MRLKAILWDVDGTLAETERDGHLVAMNAAFSELDIPWRWDERRYGELLRVAGGFERLLFDMESQPSAPASMDERRALAQRIHVLKNQRYKELVESGALPLRPGVRELFDECGASGIRMAVVTTTSRGNVAALLGAHLGPQWRDRFAAVVCAEDAPVKKPDPQAYRLVLERLQLQAGADGCDRRFGHGAGSGDRGWNTRWSSRAAGTSRMIPCRARWQSGRRSARAPVGRPAWMASRAGWGWPTSATGTNPAADVVVLPSFPVSRVNGRGLE